MLLVRQKLTEAIPLDRLAMLGPQRRAATSLGFLGPGRRVPEHCVQVCLTRAAPVAPPCMPILTAERLKELIAFEPRMVASREPFDVSAAVLVPTRESVAAKSLVECSRVRQVRVTVGDPICSLCRPLGDQTLQAFAPQKPFPDQLVEGDRGR